MDKKLKTKWVNALRSGRYKQDQGCLKVRGGGYCCLGVLAVVSGKALSTHGADGFLESFPDLMEQLPFEIQDELAKLNDEADPVPFEMLAGLIHEAL